MSADRNEIETFNVDSVWQGMTEAEKITALHAVLKQKEAAAQEVKTKDSTEADDELEIVSSSKIWYRMTEAQRNHALNNIHKYKEENIEEEETADKPPKLSPYRQEIWHLKSQEEKEQIRAEHEERINAPDYQVWRDKITYDEWLQVKEKQESGEIPKPKILTKKDMLANTYRMVLMIDKKGQIYEVKKYLQERPGEHLQKRSRLLTRSEKELQAEEEKNTHQLGKEQRQVRERPRQESDVTQVQYTHPPNYFRIQKAWTKGMITLGVIVFMGYVGINSLIMSILAEFLIPGLGEALLAGAIFLTVVSLGVLWVAGFILANIHYTIAMIIHKRRTNKKE